MKGLTLLAILSAICFGACGKEIIYQGCTPAHYDARYFLGITLSDSIDFIRWTLLINNDRYQIDCEYGLAKNGTSGFTNRKTTKFSGSLSAQDNYFTLHHGNKILYVLKINSNLLHLLDRHKAMMVGNGGYSYTLNANNPVKTDHFSIVSRQTPITHLMTFEGRTPCQELSKLLGQNKSPECDKIKWYIVLITDSSGQPSYYLKGGRGRKKEDMTRGNWQIVHGSDGRIIYKLDPEKNASAVFLVKADENVLFFSDPDGNLLTGNEHFSYTLNRTDDRADLRNN